MQARINRRVGPLSRVWLGVLLLHDAVARVLQAYPDQVPMLAMVALHVIPPLLFALLHGALRYGIRGILVFTGLCLLVGDLHRRQSFCNGTAGVVRVYRCRRNHLADCLGANDGRKQP